LLALLDERALLVLRTIPTFVPHSRIEEHARANGLRAVRTESGDAGLLAGLLEWFKR